jgi:hypothetical protein
VALGKRFQAARRSGSHVDGLNEWNVRWVGPDGYRGIVARQLQEFRRVQAERAKSLPTDAPAPLVPQPSSEKLP